ncbi:hypothetical protein BLA6860_07637 [Burkholderia lata]|nr:hypothetical protein BLA6860_07637 [Burkholderia lata]
MCPPLLSARMLGCDNVVSTSFAPDNFEYFIHIHPKPRKITLIQIDKLNRFDWDY